MCADSNLVMSISLFTMTATAVTMTMTAVIAVVAMATVIGTVIGTENTSSLKSKAYRAGHSGHRKLQFSLIIKKYTDNESIKKRKWGITMTTMTTPLEPLQALVFPLSIPVTATVPTVTTAVVSSVS